MYRVLILTKMHFVFFVRYRIFWPDWLRYFHVIYETRETVFHQLSKQNKVRRKMRRSQVFFNPLQGADEITTLASECFLNLKKTKTKTQFVSRKSQNQHRFFVQQLSLY